jgi:hypothetical protein
MERPPAVLKSFADRVAQAAASAEAAELIRLLRLSGLIASPVKDAAAPPSFVPAVYVCDPSVPPEESPHIGIWERRTENGQVSFVRRMDTMDEWHFWANHGRIDPKGTKRRVLFMGESVARGYLYDPDFTPAMALQMILDGDVGEGEFEVIDLARTNLAYEIKDLALAALQLEPDTAIVFAGNNWGVSSPTFHDIAETERALTTGGMAGLKRSCDEYLSRRSRSIATDIAAAYKNRGIPLIWIVPEFNLGDWREPATNAPHLPGGSNREWLGLREQAEQALREGDHGTAERFAQKMVQIDQGVCVTGYYLLADCRRLANDVDGERKYLELARDATAWDSSLMYTPKANRVTQDAIREVMHEYDCQTVDLPSLFKQTLNDELPGRRVFLDYCHLTSEGMQVAMGVAASCVLRSLKGVELPWYTLAGDRIAPSRETEAEASFMAAIHNAHRSQACDIVRYHCSRALKFSPHIADVMLNYIDLQTSNSVPARMSEAEDHILRLGSSLLHRYIFRINEKRLDKLLLGAIVEALEEVGIEARDHLAQLRREEHSVRQRDVDLLDYFYCSSADQAQELEGLVGPNSRTGFDRHYYRAFSPRSKFVFVGEAGYGVTFLITCRLPQPISPVQKVSIDLNGKNEVEFDVSSQWTTWEIDVSEQDILEGLNELTVHWPIPAFHSDESLSKATKALTQHKLPNFYPVFGEIHSFTAASAARVAESPHELAQVAATQAVA